jgi:hypothetical protein
MTDDLETTDARGGPRFAYAVETLLIEVGRLSRVIRRLEESSAAASEERSATLRRLSDRVMELYNAINALGELEGGEALPDEE